MLLRVWRLLTPIHTAFYVLIGLAVIYEAFQIVLSYLVSLVINLSKFNLDLYGWIAVFGGLYLFYHLFMILDNQFDWHVIRRISHEAYKHLKMVSIKKLNTLSVTWHHERNSASTVGELADGIWKIDGLVGLFSWEVVQTVFQSLESLIVLVIISPNLVPGIVIAMALFVVITMKGERAKWTYRVKRQSKYNKDWEEFAKAAQGHSDIVWFNQQQRIADDHEKLQDEIIDLAHKEHRLGVFIYNALRIFVLSVVRVITYILLVQMLLNHQVDEASLIFIAILVERMLGNLWRFARLTDRVISDSERINAVLNLQDEKEEADNGTVVLSPDISLGIEFKEVCFSYRNTYDESTGQLHSFNLKVEPGQTVALVGPTGAGKTTVIQLIAKLVQANHGDIKIGSVSVSELNSEALRMLITHVPQDAFLIDASIRDNIAFSRPNAAFNEIVKASQSAGLYDFISGLPKGFDTMIGERGVRLSGGQRQRLSIARALLAKDARIWILDEPTSAVDSLTEKKIQEELIKLTQERKVTTIIIAHRLSTIRHADKIVVMNKGRIVEEGNHEELVNQKGIYAQMVDIQYN